VTVNPIAVTGVSLNKFRYNEASGQFGFVPHKVQFIGGRSRCAAYLQTNSHFMFINYFRRYWQIQKFIRVQNAF